MSLGWIAEMHMITVGLELGERFHALKSGRREGRVNIIAALCDHNLIAPFTVEGACNRTVFETRERDLLASNTSTWTGCDNG